MDDDAGNSEKWSHAEKIAEIMIVRKATMETHWSVLGFFFLFVHCIYVIFRKVANNGLSTKNFTKLKYLSLQVIFGPKYFWLSCLLFVLWY